MMDSTRVAVVTGGGRGIGLAATQLLLADGYSVVVGDLGLDEASVALGSEVQRNKVVLHKTDVTDEDSLKELFNIALKEYGQVDTCLVNAGLFAPITPWLEMTGSTFDKMSSVNVTGAALTVKQAVLAMKQSPSGGKGCSLVLVSSVASTYGQPGMAAYVASKWAVRGLALTAAQEFADLGIRTNCIQPGATDTNMFGMFPEALKEVVKESNTLKRAATPKEIAEVMVFLAGPKSSFMNGSTVAVHAGQTPT